MTTPSVETSRIILRPLKISDAGTIFTNWASDPEVSKYMRWDTHKTVDVTIEWLTLEEKNIDKDDSYSWGFVLKETGGLIGSGGLLYNSEYEMFEVGYVIMKKYWGMGLATEAARACVDFAFNELDQNKLHVRHAKENIASGRVIEKLGFVYQSDGKYSSFDGKRITESREYILEKPQC
jgi:ribosomal-protein-alanine N-acetyltransferase